MASVQKVQGCPEFNDKEKSAICEAMKKAEAALANCNDAKSCHERAIVAGAMCYDGRRALWLSRSHEWKGCYVVEPPKNNANGAFVHKSIEIGIPERLHGSKAAVIYSTIDKMYPGVGYLLAWSKSDNCAEKPKVYVEAGNSSRFVNMSWDEIECKLDASSDKSKSMDPETRAAAFAEIKDQGGNLALVGSHFGYIIN